ncbi:hypothetical protein NL676_025161 [Syzygium grande]|nr:hypothetical protein NL676_025161 [Syzygium grande]
MLCRFNPRRNDLDQEHSVKATARRRKQRDSPSTLSHILNLFREKQSVKMLSGIQVEQKGTMVGGYARGATKQLGRSLQYAFDATRGKHQSRQPAIRTARDVEFGCAAAPAELVEGGSTGPGTVLACN